MFVENLINTSLAPKKIIHTSKFQVSRTRKCYYSRTQCLAKFLQSPSENPVEIPASIFSGFFRGFYLRFRSFCSDSIGNLSCDLIPTTYRFLRDALSILRQINLWAPATFVQLHASIKPLFTIVEIVFRLTVRPTTLYWAPNNIRYADSLKKLYGRLFSVNRSRVSVSTPSPVHFFFTAP